MANRGHTDVQRGFSKRGGPRHRRHSRRPRTGKKQRLIERPKTRVVDGAPGHVTIVRQVEQMRSQ